MTQYILGLDQGTTGTTAALIDSESFELVGKINQEYPQHYPKPGQVEHDLNDIWKSTEETIKKLLKNYNVDSNQIVTIGITNQRETTCAFNKKGEPLCRAIVWQDRRTAERCHDLKNSNQAELLRKKTGLTIDPYFSATKMEWLLENNTQVAKAAANNDLCFGNIDTFLLYKLTAGQSYFTEGSNASRTMLMDLQSCQWDKTILEIFKLKENFLPGIKNSFGKFGVTKNLSFLKDGIPITGILGDQQAALFGQAGIEKGSFKCTYGTGAFALLNTGDQIHFSTSSGLLSTVAYLHNGKPCYALEGSCYIAGAAVQWLRDNMNFITSSPDVEEMAKKIKNLDEMQNVLFLPFFTGIGSPYWIPEAKGAILGLSRDTNKNHLARACLEGIALSIHDLIASFEKNSHTKIKSMKVDGGAVANNLLLEIQATVSQLEVIRPHVIETTVFGAALAAAIGAGLIEKNQIHSLWRKDRSFNHVDSWDDFYTKKKVQWNEAIKRLYF